LKTQKQAQSGDGNKKGTPLYSAQRVSLDTSAALSVVRPFVYTQGRTLSVSECVRSVVNEILRCAQNRHRVLSEAKDEVEPLDERVSLNEGEIHYFRRSGRKR
jgi:hypothetical protein